MPGRPAAGQLTAGPLRFAADGAGEVVVVVGLRPEHLRLGEGADARVTLVENLGGEAVVYLDMQGQALTAAMPLLDTAPPEIDAMVGVTVDPAEVCLFDATSGARISTIALRKAGTHG